MFSFVESDSLCGRRFRSVVPRWWVTINGQPLNSPKMIRFQELTEDEYFCSEQGVVFVNTSSTEPLVCLRYFGPEVHLRLRK